MNPPNPSPNPPASRMWLWVLAAIVLHFAVWIAWFTIAMQHPVIEVPLTSAR